jgi:hypothetical protein
MSIVEQEIGVPWAWIHVAISCAGVLLVSACYLLSPPEVVGANLLQDLSVAQSATLTERGFMRWIAIGGLLINPTGAIGAFGLAQSAGKAGSQRQVIGFYWLAITAIIFLFVDLLLGFGLPAAARGELAGFAFAKRLFDGLTGAGSFAYGLSAVFLAWPSHSHATTLAPRALMRALLAVGVIVTTAGPLVLLRVNAGLVAGLGQVALTMLYGAVSLYNLSAAAAPAGQLRVSDQAAG